MSKIIFLIFLFLCGGVLKASSEDNETKNHLKKYHIVELPIIFENNILGEIDVQIVDTKVLYQIRKAPLLNLLEKIVDNEVLDTIRFYLGKEWIEIDFLKQYGVSFQFEYQNLLVFMFVRPDMRITKNFDLEINDIPSWAKNSLNPAPFSGYTNVYLYKTFSDIQIQQRLTADMLSVFNLKQNVLSFDYTYDESLSKKWYLNDVYYTRDFPAEGFRLRMGDIQTTSYSHIRSFNLLGMQIETEFETNPYKTIYPRSNHEFFLQRKSEVQVLVNGSMVRTLYLNSGRYRLNDLPFNQGINDIVLIIKDDQGRLERVHFNTYNSFLLLDKGLHRRGFAIGTPSYRDANKKRYKSKDEGIVNIYNYTGLSKYMTGGFNIQYNQDVQIVGGSLIFAGSAGQFSLHNTYSNRNSSYSPAVQLGYLYQDYPKGISFSRRQFSFEMEYLSPGFRQVDQDSFNEFMYSFSTSFGHTLWAGSFAGLGVRYTPAFGDHFEAYTYSLNIHQNINRYLSANVQLSHQRPVDGKEIQTYSIFLTTVLPELNQTVVATSNSYNNENSMIWRYNGHGHAHSKSGYVQLNKQTNQYLVDAGAQYQSQRYELRGDFANRWKDSSESTRGTLGLFTSLVFAQNQMGFSRPIYDSFALLKTDDDFKNDILRFNQTGDYFDAELKGADQSAISTLSSYRYHRLQVDSGRLMPGHTLKKDEYSLLPRYRSGFLIKPLKKFEISAYGFLQGPQGNFNLVSGRIINRDNPKTIFEFFTNREGKFYLEGIIPGHYQIELEDGNARFDGIVIGKDASGVVNLGVIKGR